MPNLLFHSVALAQLDGSPDFVRYSQADGDDSTETTLSWSRIPNQQGKEVGSTFAVDVRPFLSGTGSATATLSVTPGFAFLGNWSLVGDEIQYTGVGIVNGFVKIRAVKDAVTVDSIVLSYQSVAAQGTDTKAPTIPTGLTVIEDGADNNVDLTWDASSDPGDAADGVPFSGVKEYQIRRDASALAIVSSPSGGLNTVLVTQTVGSYTVGSDAVTRSGADHSVLCSGVNVAGTGDDFLYRRSENLIPGDFTIICKCNAWPDITSTPFAKMGLMVRESNDRGSKFAGVVLRNNGVRREERTVTDGTKTHSAVFTAFDPDSVIPVWLSLSRTGDQWKTRASSDGNVWTVIDDFTLLMPVSVYVGIFAVTSVDGTQKTFDFDQVSIQNLAVLSYEDTTVVADTTYSYTVDAKDLESTPNVSAQSPSVSVTTSPDETGGNPTGTLKAIWTFEDGTPEDASEFPTDGQTPALGANPSAKAGEMEVSTDQALQGTSSLHAFLDGTGGAVGNTYRRQLKIRIKPHPTLPQGSNRNWGMAELGEYWFGWGIYVPTSHTVTSNVYEICMQSLWRTPDANAGDRNPMLVVDSGAGIGLGNFTSYGRTIQTLLGDKDDADVVFGEQCAPMVSGWTGVVQHIIWDYSNSGTGRYEIWMRNSATNGWQQYINYSGPFGPNDGADSQGNWDLGIYKGWRNNEAGTSDPVSNRKFYFDNIQYSLDDGNFDLVEPKGF